MFGKFFTKRVALSAVAFAVVAVAGIAIGLHHPRAGRGHQRRQRHDAGCHAGARRRQDRTPARQGRRARHIALALFRESVKETGLSAGPPS